MDADYYATRPRTPTAGASAPRLPRAEERLRAAADRKWLRVLERAVGGWAPTLRQSVALVALFLAAAMAVIITLGGIGVILVSCLAVALTWRWATARIPRR